jgi:hypothetical protein
MDDHWHCHLIKTSFSYSPSSRVSLYQLHLTPGSSTIQMYGHLQSLRKRWCWWTHSCCHVSKKVSSPCVWSYILGFSELHSSCCSCSWQPADNSSLDLHVKSWIPRRALVNSWQRQSAGWRVSDILVVGTRA